MSESLWLQSSRRPAASTMATPVPCGLLQSMIPKSGYRFSVKIMLKLNNLRPVEIQRELMTAAAR
jgi:hypothetical protein